MLAVERHPASVALKLAEAVGIEPCPYLIDWLSADKSVEPLSVAVVRLLAVFHYCHAVVKAFLELRSKVLIAYSSVCLSKSSEVMTTDMAFERPVAKSPVGE